MVHLCKKLQCAFTLARALKYSKKMYAFMQHISTIRRKISQSSVRASRMVKCLAWHRWNVFFALSRQEQICADKSGGLDEVLCVRCSNSKPARLMRAQTNGSDRTKIHPPKCHTTESAFETLSGKTRRRDGEVQVDLTLLLCQVWGKWKCAVYLSQWMWHHKTHGRKDLKVRS